MDARTLLEIEVERIPGAGEKKGYTFKKSVDLRRVRGVLRG